MFRSLFRPLGQLANVRQVLQGIRKTPLFELTKPFSQFLTQKVSLMPMISVNKKNIVSTLGTANVNSVQIREYKRKMRLRKRCQACYFLWRNGRLYVECKAHPRHKQHHRFSLEKGYDHLAHGYHVPEKR